MLRDLTKSTLASGMHFLGVDRMIGDRRGIRKLPLVICYHRVVEDFDESARYSIPSMLVSTSTFEQHLDWIGKRYEFVTLDQITATYDSGAVPDRPMAAVTFDDGYADVYHHAFPVLQRKGIPAATFVVTDLVGTQRLPWHDALYLFFATGIRQWQETTGGGTMLAFTETLELDSWLAANLRFHTALVHDLPAKPFPLTRACLGSLTSFQLDELVRQLGERIFIDDAVARQFVALNWDELRTMSRAGMTIGSHTRSHVMLDNESPETVVEEVRESRRVLEKELGTEIRHFAYPDGRFNADSVKAVAQAGYRGGYTICMHGIASSPSLTVPRRVMWEKSCMDGSGRFSPAILSCQINGIFEPAFHCRMNH